MNSLAFSPDGNMIVSVSSDKTIKLWKKMNGSLLKTFKGQDCVKSVRFSPDC